MSGTCDNNDCIERCDQMADEIDTVRSILDDCTSSLGDLVDSAEHDADINQVTGRCDDLDGAMTTIRQEQAATTNTIELLQFTVASCGDRLDQFDTAVHFGELTADVREQMQEQGEAAQTAIALNYRWIEQLESDYDSIDHHTHLHHRFVREQKQLNKEQEARLTSNDLWTEALHDIVNAHDAEFGVQRSDFCNLLQQIGDGIRGQLHAVNVRLQNVEHSFNKLPVGLASEPFIQHVVAVSKCTPKRGKKRSSTYTIMTPVRRSPRLASTPLRATETKLYP